MTHCKEKATQGKVDCNGASGDDRINTTPPLYVKEKLSRICI